MQVFWRLTLVFQPQGIRPKLQIKPEDEHFVSHSFLFNHYLSKYLGSASDTASLSARVGDNNRSTRSQHTEGILVGEIILHEGNVLLFRGVSGREAWSRTSLVS